jgi:Capsule assembly protein Wzi
MQFIKTVAKLVLFILPISALGQATYLQQGAKEYTFINRLEIKQQTNTDLNFSTLKPFNRKHIVRQAEFLDSARMGYRDSMGMDKYKEWTDLDLSSVDEYNLQSLLMNSAEWVTTPKDGFLSKKPILKHFYKTKANMFEVNNKNLFLAINPMLQVQQAIEPGYDQSIFINTRGISARGLIAKKIGFSTFVTDNQERGPLFYQRYVDTNRAVPGVGFYKPFKKNALDYLDARGSVTFNASKFVDIQFGFDKNFIGNGFRSLFLSDWGNSYTFLKLNTKVWKFNYQNLFMELMPQFRKNGDSLLDRKYAAMHHLSINVTKWLNIGLFEGVVFGRKNRFDFSYLNPVILYRHIEGQNGSPDNALLGLDFKANVAHRMQFYGQLMLDEFAIDDVRKLPTSWRNKFGIQLGAKYVDAFGIKNLDLQAEVNRVRPFTYSHRDTIGNYTHYNQPLAHPLGANFQELVAVANYQPFNKLNINARLIYYQQGLDSAGVNYGANIFKDYDTRDLNSNDFFLLKGRKATALNATLNISYELRENIFLDGTLQSRNYKIAGLGGQSNTTLFTAGVRINMFRRNYDF